MCRSSGTAETLITARPKLPVNNFRPPSSPNGAVAVRTIAASIGVAGKSRQRSCFSPFDVGTLPYSRKPPGTTVFTSLCIVPLSINSRITKPGPPAA